MKKAKLFMMLALLVMGVSNVWSETKDYYVNYEREFIQGGYTIDASKSTRITKIETFGSLTSLGTQEVGDRMIRVTFTRGTSGWSEWDDDRTNYEIAGELLKCITAKDLPDYTENVWIYRNQTGTMWNTSYTGGNTVYITYQYNKNDYTTWTSGNFTYSTLYTKTNTTNVKNTIKLPANQCAIQLNTYTQSEITIPVKDPQKSYDVVAIQTHGVCENVRHSIPMTGCNDYGGTINYEDAYNNWSNSNLKKVTFAKTSKIRSIGDYAFNSCKVLETIEIPQSVEYLGEACFSMCVGLTDGLTFERTSGASFTTGIKVIRNYTFWLCNAMTSLELPDGIIVIEGQQSGSAMQYMTSLTHLRLPNTLVAVGPHFLCDASCLEEVTIPASVKYIDGACFHGCEKLQEVYLLGPASALQGVYDGSDTFGNNPTLCKGYVQNCVFITTQENIRGYMEDENGVWQLIADNRQTRCDENGVWAVKVDEAGHVVRDASGKLVYEMDENNQHVYLKYADGTNVKATECGQGRGNALTYLPDQKMNFTPGKWVTVIFPKAYTQDELKATFGNDVVLAKMTGFLSPDYSYVNGKRTYHLNFTQQTAADANTPYMIKPGQKNGTNPYDVTMIAANEMNESYREELTKDHALTINASDNSEVIMYGWYKKREMKQWEFYFMNPLKNGVYNTACVFKRIVDPAEAPTIKAFRCYWRIWLEGEAQDAGAGAKSAFFSFADDDETTGIEQTESNISIEIGNIYDLNGHKMDLKKEDLPKGLFIINGKKVMINK